jgi:hypothetical protein
VSKSNARRETRPLKLWPYGTTAILSLQPRDPSSRALFAVGFYSLSSEVRSIRNWDFFSDDAWFRLQGYINKHTNRYWNSQNPHLTHEVLLHPAKFDVWCALSASIPGPALF